MSFGALAFLNPWLLAGLAALPVIYWLLRTVPPRPRQVPFPATRILVGLEAKETTPAKTPWWLTLIRMLAATLVIFALAEPVLNPDRETELKGSGPVVLVVDNGWAAASRWALRTRMLDRLIGEAEAQSRPVVIVPTANATKSPSVRIEAPASARSAATALQPHPFEPDRRAALAALETALAAQPPASAIWLTDSIDHDSQTGAFAAKLAGLASAGLTVVEAPAGEEALGVTASLGKNGRLEATVVRVGGTAREGVLAAFSARGQRLAEAPFAMAAHETSATAAFELPLELRNQVTRIEIVGEPSAAAVQLLDARTQWNRVGLISGASREQAQPLLGPLYYIQKALGPFAELVEPRDSNLARGLDTIFTQNASIAMLTDIGTLPGELETRVEDWVRKGGVLVRFAGPRLENGGDDLLPVALRIGGRTLGGALSWSTPQPLAPFTDDSLFAGLAIPADVTVNRQILADPARLGPDVKIWARLKDGTPLVTAASRGAGQIVLFHVTANSDWSNLPLSGLFVEMLRRITTLGKRAGGTEAALADTGNKEAPPSADSVLAPIQVLDGFGTLRPPLPTVQAVPAAEFANLKPNAEHPPGYYGPQESLRAINLISPKTYLRPLPALPAAERRAYEGNVATPLKPWMLVTALMLLFIDIIAVILLQIGGVGFRRRPVAPAAGLFVIAVVLAAGIAPSSEAQSYTQALPSAPRERLADQALALRATAKVTFGYVLTGNPNTDEASRNGLIGLGKVLTARTAVEPGEPYGVSITEDEIAFFPILYWPVPADARPLPEPTLAKIDAYMKQGGMVIFDTRDYGQGVPTGLSLQSGGEKGNSLQRLLGRLDIPRLEPVPEGHVLTKSFYLLRTFPGRWDGGQLWVEAEPSDAAEHGRKARRTDGVSSILVTSNDFAAAWALDDRNRPIYPTVPGGEAQREQAFRTGINIVMYALTGNYKADQVHVPALLERLGQ
jgi:Domain of unknown function (DUF4159)/Aerotolerance regulator N-terminal